MRKLILSILLLCINCSTTWTARGISKNMDSCLDVSSDYANNPLTEKQCYCVIHARDLCLKQGLPKNCAWDGWSDEDDDSWTISACLKREQRFQLEESSDLLGYESQ